MQNQQIEQQQKAGRMQLGHHARCARRFRPGHVYCKVRAVGGPMAVGNLIGGTVGAIAGGLFD